MATLGLLAAAAVQAQLYKWVDENGRTQYTQTPPPGKKAEQILQKKPPAAAVNRPADGKDKPKPSEEAADSGVHRDVQRMAGEWRTRPGGVVQVRFYVTAGPSPFLVSQAWSASGVTAMGTDKRYVVDGVDGRGILTAVDAGQGVDATLPKTIHYQLQGDTLVLTIDSGPYAGQHRLTRPETK
jgi:hypothetical protein